MVKNAKPKKQAKTKAVQSASGKLKNIWHKKWQVILIAVVFVGILGFIGMNQLIIYNQKQQFKAAEESLDAIYADIVKEIGQPTSMQKDKSCGYSSAKIGEGRIGCSISLDAEYLVSSAPDTTKLSSKIKSVLQKINTITISFENTGKYTTGKNSSLSDYTSYTIKLDEAKDLSCDLSIKYLDKDDKSNNLPSKENIMRLYVGCGGYPSTEIYPVNL